MAQKKRTALGEGTAPGWRIPDSILDEYRRWCDKYKRGYEDEAAKAFFLWSRLPCQIREWTERSMAGDPEFGASFWKVFEDSFDEAAHELKKRLRGAEKATQEQ
jgi:hypothetical protein